MKARPILFSSPMVRALIAGSKSQTRRVVKPQPPAEAAGAGVITSPDPKADGLWSWLDHATDLDCGLVGDDFRCPYGLPGDLLWVREAHYRFGHWEPVPGVKTATGRMKWRFVADTDELRFDAPASFRGGRHHKDPSTPAWHLRLARFMPRTASRLTLEITDVRVERLQAISEADAVAEGIERPGIGAPFWKSYADDVMPTLDPAESYMGLWNSINGPDADFANPWCWALSFKVHRANVDQVLAEHAA